MTLWRLARGVLAVAGTLACASGGAGDEPPAEQDACVVGVETFPGEPGQTCDYGDFDCAYASAECIEGTPNTLGPCICRRAFPVNVTDESSFPIEAATFGPDNVFYWSTYVFVVGAPASNITSTNGLAIRVDGHVGKLRVTEDTIYVASNPLMAFSLTGEPLPAPTEDVAFPPQAGRVTSDEMGLHLDGVKLTEPARAFSETPDGVYYIPSSFPFSVDYVAFAEPGVPRMIAVRGGMPFENVWAQDKLVYVTMRSDNDLTALLRADLSIVGTQKPN